MRASAGYFYPATRSHMGRNIWRNTQLELSLEDMWSARGAAALLLPLEKLQKYPFALLWREVCKGRAFALQEARELNAGRLRLGCLVHAKAPQHLLGDAPSRPAGTRRSEIYIAPFRMPRRLANFVPLAEECFGKLFTPPVTIAS